MKNIRVLALGTILVFSFATGALAQTQNTTDSDQPTIQSEDKAAPATDQQTTAEPEQQAAPATDAE